MKKTVRRIERGWPGHFCSWYRCEFRRNTLLQYCGIEIVVSTVGKLAKINAYDKEIVEYDTVCGGNYYETCVFHADKKDHRFRDADHKMDEIYLGDNNKINILDAEDLANIMHERVVDEIVDRLVSGETFSKDGGL